ncbi:MAG TPA: carbon monoxide dehydrogenase subunit G [Rhizomicrobium sp.]|nr:carbon monoxide dehydrogenase subunit G [Rhizomicrobium sp.]
MQMNGSERIQASKEAVWAALNDVDVLKQCIPGCESLEKTGDNAFEAKATLKIGPVKATFKGKVTLDEMDPPHRCVLRGEGQGGVAGFAKGEAEVLLEPEDGQTALTYTAKANIGGKLAQIGQRLIDGAAKQIADDFFQRFSEAVSPPPPVIEAPAETAAPGAASAEAAGLATTPTPPPHHHEPISREVWVIGLIAVIVIVLIFFGMVL